MSEQPTCEERWEGALERTMESLREMGGDPQQLSEYGLSFEYDVDEGAFIWCMSWGGPADYFHFYADVGSHGFKCHKVEYQFQDWFDNHTEEVRDADGGFLINLFDSYFAEMAPAALEEALDD